MADDKLLLIFTNGAGQSFVLVDEIRAIVAFDDGGFSSEIILRDSTSLFATETPSDLIERLTECLTT